MIGSLYSVAELRDLLVAKDQEMKALEDAWRAYDPTWMGVDSAGDNVWMADFNTLKARYGAARGSANAAIALGEASKKPDNEIAADGEYRGVLRALQVQSGLVSAGDLQDLWNRLQNAMTAHAVASGFKPPVIHVPGGVWQPTKGSDVDLNRLQGLENDPIATSVGLAMHAAGLGRDPTNPLTPPPPPSKGPGVGTLLAIGGGLTLAAIAAAKIGWKVLKPF